MKKAFIRKVATYGQEIGGYILVIVNANLRRLFCLSVSSGGRQIRTMFF